MARIFGVVSLLTFALSAIFHFTTYIPAIPISMHLAWPIHLVIMAVFAAMVFNLVAQEKREPKRSGTGLFASWRAASQQRKEFQSKLLAYVPQPLRVVCVVAFIYAMINFALFAMLMEGSPSVKNGNYYLHNHGRKIRDLSEEEYRRFLAYELRGFSGHWMLCSIIPAAYFLTVYPKLQQSREQEAKRQTNAPEPPMRSV